MQIVNYPEITELDPAFIMLADGENGTKKIRIDNMVQSFMDQLSVEMHRNIVRGKNLGTSITDDQLQAIYDGSFKDLYVGDYWVINNIVWRIVDIDYWMNNWYPAINGYTTDHHLVIMPDHILFSAKMNDSNVTTGAIIGSKMYTEYFAPALTTIESAFGAANILEHGELLANAVTNGHESAGAWYNRKADLPNEIMMLGTYVGKAQNEGTLVPYVWTVDKTQLALMRMVPKFINPHNENQWERDVVSASNFALVNNDGQTTNSGASASRGVRPVFGVKGKQKAA